MTSKPDFHKLSISELLEIIGWSKTMPATKLGIQPRSFARWVFGVGKYRTPPLVREWLEDLAQHHYHHPKPQGWKTEGDDGVGD